MQYSERNCTLEALSELERTKYVDPFALRVGLQYVKGLPRGSQDRVSVTAEYRKPVLNAPHSTLRWKPRWTSAPGTFSSFATAAFIAVGLGCESRM